jgi:DNA-binding transcriptional LysR family regulator
MDRFAAMQAFVKVVESGSFVRAAERLGLSTSALSARVAELEAHLGARLLHRTTRRLSLTEPGQAYYERCVPLLVEIDEAEAIVGQSSASPRGTIRLACSYNMGQHRIAPAIADFVARYPDVRFEVMVSDRVVDLVDEGFDLAIRVGAVGSEQQVARPLGQMQLVLAAAPAYLKKHGVPRTLNDLAQHAALTYAYSASGRVYALLDRDGRTHEVRVNGVLHANNGEVLMAAAIHGLGIVYEPDFMLNDALADGRLVRVLPQYEGRRGGIWAVYPSRRHLSLKVRLFVDFVAERFARGISGPARPASRVRGTERPASARSTARRSRRST